MSDNPHTQTGRFVGEDESAEVSVVVVTYNSADELPELIESLRREAVDVRMRVIVADNASHDTTVAVASSHDDVQVVSTGGNVGYAAGINAAAALVSAEEPLLILNPDLRVAGGAVRALLRSSVDEDRVGVVAPRILDSEGRRTVSLYNEPGIVRSFADAFLGPLWKSRPAALTEWVRDPDRYARRGRADWVSGAALLVTPAARRAVGEWDERYFLYSEETDYCRRVRDAGFAVVFEPGASVTHHQGASGSSAALDALLAVNRLRYVRKHAPARAPLYRAAAIAGAALRVRRTASGPTVLRTLVGEKTWADLPSPSWEGAGAGSSGVAIIIPAHDEAKVIGRTLSGLAGLAQSGAADVIVVCNACTDGTARVAAEFAGVRVIEIDEASKTAAINAGVEATGAECLIVLDADIDLSPIAVAAVARALRAPGLLAARPPFRYDVSGASPAVRAYYRARLRIPGMSSALWGAGVYALNRAGWDTVGPLPRVVADDFYVDERIPAAQKRVVPTIPVVVRMPRTRRALTSVLVRARRGPAELQTDRGRSTARSLARTVRGPVSLFDAVAYTLLTLDARRRARSKGRETAWERDETSRS